MGILQDRIKSTRLKRNMTLKELANKLNVKEATMQRYESGEIKNVKHETIVMLADALDVSPSYLMGWDEEPSSPSLPANIRPITKKRFPMLGEIACGKPIYASEDHESYIDASATIDADFCLTAKGDSMIGARIHDGDVVFIKAMPIVDNGAIAAVIVGDEATLKRWYYYPDQQKLVLNAENSAYAPLVYVGEELNTITCLGKAVCFMSNL